MLGPLVEMEIMSETKEIGICVFRIVPFVPCKKAKKRVTHFPQTSHSMTSFSLKMFMLLHLYSYLEATYSLVYNVL